MLTGKYSLVNQQAEMDALWVEEAEKRPQAVEQGVVSSIPGEQVFRELHSRI